MSNGEGFLIAVFVLIAALFLSFCSYQEGLTKGRCDALGGKFVQGTCYKNLEVLK
jgi:hypothetical protein